MPVTVGIRREEKNRWEARAPLTPRDVADLEERHGLAFRVQPSEIRAFSDVDYLAAGAVIDEDLSACDIILAIKEIPPEQILPGKTHVFFSHTIKGQRRNLPLLARLLEAECQLIDYERIVDGKGRRLISFGRFAGIAGMIETLRALGRRLEWKGWDTPLARMEPAHSYGGLNRAKRALSAIGAELLAGIPREITPLFLGTTGYGRVGSGVREILNTLPCLEVEPPHIRRVPPGGVGIYKVAFKPEHFVERVRPPRYFRRGDYYRNPRDYRSVFDRYWPMLTALVNGMYWDEGFPRLITKAGLQHGFRSRPAPRLEVVGDISCDIGGAVEFTVRTTDPDEPVYVYDPERHGITPGVEGPGPAVMAIDNLPCLFPRESSHAFSTVLALLLPALASATTSGRFEGSGLPPELMSACVVWRGELTPEYRYLERFLRS